MKTWRCRTQTMPFARRRYGLSAHVTEGPNIQEWGVSWQASLEMRILPSAPASQRLRHYLVFMGTSTIQEPARWYPNPWRKSIGILSTTTTGQSIRGHRELLRLLPLHGQPHSGSRHAPVAVPQISPFSAATRALKCRPDPGEALSILRGLLGFIAFRPDSLHEPRIHCT